MPMANIFFIIYIKVETLILSSKLLLRKIISSSEFKLKCLTFNFIIIFYILIF